MRKPLALFFLLAPQELFFQRHPYIGLFIAYGILFPAILLIGCYGVYRGLRFIRSSLKIFFLFSLLCFSASAAAAGTRDYSGAFAPVAPPPQATTPVVAPVIIAPLNLQPVMNDSAQMAVDVQAMLTQANGNFLTLANSFNTLVAAIQDLQARVAALEHPTPPVQTGPITVDLTTLPAGPLSGIVSTINWNSGMWTATAQGVQPAVLGQGSRNFVIPAGKVLASITIECLTQACSVKLTDANGNTFTSPVFGAGTINAVPTIWTAASGAVTLGTPISAATDLRIRSVTF
jgi:hypothetical protein